MPKDYQNRSCGAGALARLVAERRQNDLLKNKKASREGGPNVLTNDERPKTND